MAVHSLEWYCTALTSSCTSQGRYNECLSLANPGCEHRAMEVKADILEYWQGSEGDSVICDPENVEVAQSLVRAQIWTRIGAYLTVEDACSARDSSELLCHKTAEWLAQNNFYLARKRVTDQKATCLALYNYKCTNGPKIYCTGCGNPTCLEHVSVYWIHLRGSGPSFLCEMCVLERLEKGTAVETGLCRIPLKGFYPFNVATPSRNGELRTFELWLGSK